MALTPRGYNPLRWKCDESGCFNTKRRPKIEVFKECFPRGISFGDVDGLVELRGSFCLLEWKTGANPNIPQGQHRSFLAFTEQRLGNVVYVVEGDAETMVVRRFCRYWNGKQLAWKRDDLDGVKGSIKGWVRHVTQCAAPGSAAA